MLVESTIKIEKIDVTIALHDLRTKILDNLEHLDNETLSELAGDFGWYAQLTNQASLDRDPDYKPDWQIEKELEQDFYQQFVISVYDENELGE